MILIDERTSASTADAPVDDPRAVNEVLALLDTTWLDSVVHARPTHYNIATSVVCNIKCVFCPRQTMLAEVGDTFGYLTAEHFDSVAPYLDSALRTGMFGLGEPFLNPRFFDFLKAAKAHGTYCMTSSHGMSLKPRIVDKILDGGLDELCVSIDGASARTTNFLRNGADFDTIVRQVTDLIRRRNERGQKHPRVHVSFTVSKYNVWEMPAAVRLVARMGADRIAFSNLSLDHPEHAHVSVVGSRVHRFNMRRARTIGERLGVEVTDFYQIPHPWKEQTKREPAEGGRFGCPEAWRAVIVERNGDLKPCCYMNFSYGNLKDGDIGAHINGPKAVELRRTFTEGRFLNTCKGCGQFYHVSTADTVEAVQRAERKLRAGRFSDPTHILLEEKIRYFRDLAKAKGVDIP